MAKILISRDNQVGVTDSCDLVSGIIQSLR